jgi:hypothetical protein
MKIERVINKPRVTIEQFAEEHDLVMVVHSSIDAQSPNYRASFKGVEVVNGGFLYSLCGRGPTEADAINDYSRSISRQTIRLTNGKRIDVPELAVYQNR